MHQRQKIPYRNLNALRINSLSMGWRSVFLIYLQRTSETKLIALLAQRWERIRSSSMCYTQKPANIVNQLCLKLAMALSSPITTPSDIEALKPNTGPYCLLMPSLENSEDVYGGNIHSLQLHEFVLSDKERVFIPLVPCLHQASISDAGQLRHIVGIDEQYPELTTSEIERVSMHSKQATELHQSILALNKQRLLGEDIGAKLSQLVMTLRSGGVNRGSGAELNAGAEANLGILTFNNYWKELSEQQKAAIFAETPELRDIIGRLFRPEDVNIQRNEILR